MSVLPFPPVVGGGDWGLFCCVAHECGRKPSENYQHPPPPPPNPEFEISNICVMQKIRTRTICHVVLSSVPPSFNSPNPLSFFFFSFFFLGACLFFFFLFFFLSPSSSDHVIVHKVLKHGFIQKIEEVIEEEKVRVCGPAGSSRLPLFYLPLPFPSRARFAFRHGRQ